MKLEPSLMILKQAVPDTEADFLDKKERFESKCDHAATEREIFHSSYGDPDCPYFD